MGSGRAVLRRIIPQRLRTALKAMRSQFRSAQRVMTPATTSSQLADALRAGGLREGDVLAVHSSLAKLGHVEGGADAVIGSLIEVVGPDGSIVMPSYCEAESAFAKSASDSPIDLRTEPSLTGKITEMFRRRPDVLRSSHPFSSMCAWGKHAQFLTSGHELDPRICHKDSPLGRLLELDGKIVGLGVTLGPISFYHVVEDTWEGFPFYTYVSPASDVTYVDGHGSKQTRSVAYYDRTISRTRIDHDEGAWALAFFTRHLTEKGILHRFSLQGADAWWMSSRALYEELKRLAADGITIYSTETDRNAADQTGSLVRS